MSCGLWSCGFFFSNLVFSFQPPSTPPMLCNMTHIFFIYLWLVEELMNRAVREWRVNLGAERNGQVSDGEGTNGQKKKQVGMCLTTPDNSGANWTMIMWEYRKSWWNKINVVKSDLRRGSMSLPDVKHEELRSRISNSGYYEMVITCCFKWVKGRNDWTDSGRQFQLSGSWG